MKISLIIPAHNEEHYIKNCLDYALDEISLDLVQEIIVVDNASSDATYSLVSDYITHHPIVKIIQAEVKWLTHARQVGYQHAQWEIVAYIDADTRMPHWWYQTIIDQFTRDPKVWFVSWPYSYYDYTWYGRASNWIYWRWIAYPLYLCVWYLGVGWNFAIRRSILDTINGFDTTIVFYGEDTDIARRAAQHSKTLFLLDLVMPTSARRFAWQWTIKTTITYAINFFSQVLMHKPVTKNYKDFR